MVALLSTAASGMGQDPLVAAVQKRQELVRSVDIKFHIKEFEAKGSRSADAAVAPGGKAGLVIPAQDTTMESDNRLVLDGSKGRFENNHPMWHLPSGELTQKQTLSASNGELGKVFYPGGIGIGTEVQGILCRDARVMEIGIVYLTPILMHFRGADPATTPYHTSVIKNTGQKLPMAGGVWVEYQHPLSKDAVVELWYDPATGYDLRRIRKLRRGVPYEQYEIQYQRIPGIDSAPMSWVRTEYDAGKVRKVTTVTVTEIRINPPLEAGEFEITFPPGTKVYDQKTQKEYRVQDTGDMRELDPSGKEIGASVSQPGTPWWSRNKWLMVGIGAALAVLCAVVILRRRSKPHGTAPVVLPNPQGRS
jgi:hypothetical protein